MIPPRDAGRPIEILLVEDNPGDVELAREGLEAGKIPSNLHVVGDGEEAMALLRLEGKYADKPRPDIILLDLNLPRKDGREVLREIKSDDRLKHTPVVVMTSSKNQADVMKSYQLHANCYIVKPVKFSDFIIVLKAIESFWFNIVTLPPELSA